jgi:hypothetical protein
MWTPNPERLVKVLLHSRGEDVETPWAEDLGADPRRPWMRLVRLGNVPFLHAKPTYGDVIAAERDESGTWSWDSRGRPYQEIVDHLLVEDSGRWSMIVDYTLTANASCELTAAFRQLDRLGDASEIAVEGCYASGDGRGGRAYLAVPRTLGVEAVLQLLVGARLPLTFALIHPRDDG